MSSNENWLSFWTKYILQDGDLKVMGYNSENYRNEDYRQLDEEMQGDYRNHVWIIHFLVGNYWNKVPW